MSRPAITAQGYKLLARAIGSVLAEAAGDGLYDHKLLIDAIIVELEHDNPSFDAARFRRAIEAVRLAESED